MASGYRNSAGTDTDDLYDADTVGDGPQASGFRRSDGTTLRYASASYGTPGAAMGMRLSNGVDIGTLWAKKGTASYTLPFNGQSYTHDTGRGTATITVTFKADGTYTIVGGTTLASGTWLPAGDSAASYTVQYIESGAYSGQDDSGGGDSFTNGAPGQTSVSSSPAFSISASAKTVSVNAQNSCGLTITLYKNGVKRLSAWCDLEVSAAG